MDIGQRIKEIRLKKNLTLNDIAKKINSSSGFLSDIEHGKSIPSMTKLENICGALNVTLGEFFKTSKESKELSLSEMLKEIYDNAPESKWPVSALIVKQLIEMGLINEDGTMSPQVQKLVTESIALQAKLQNITKKSE